jgi:hypothetical protein
MDIPPYVDSLRQDLAAAAAAGGPEARAAADRLALALDPAVRLALMDALSQAAAEITGELGNGSIEVRLKGREPQFVVDVPTMPIQAVAPPTPPAPPETGDVEMEEDDSVARITVRIPESVKYKAEELAAKSGPSLNSWIVNVVRAATRDRAINVDIDLSSLPFVEGGPRGPVGPRSRNRSGKRMSGWV